MAYAFNVKSDKENPVLERREIVAEVDHAGSPTPAVAAVEADLAKKFECEPANVEVTQIFSGVGVARSTVRAYIWKGTKPAKKVKVKKAEEAKK